MPIGFIASIAGPVIGGLIGGSATESAAQTQADAQTQAAANTMAMFQQQQKNLQPWMTGGTSALSAEQQFMGIDPTGKTPMNMMAPGARPFDASMMPMDPSYQWRLGQGQNAILNNMSAMGGTFSGNTARALQDYTQGLASTQYQTSLGNYNNWQQALFNRLNAMSGTGANAAAGVAGLGMNAVGAAGDYGVGAAGSLAGGQLGATNALMGGVGQGINNYMLYNMMQQNPSGFGNTTADMSIWNNQATLAGAGMYPVM
ncbi:MAG: hypothetical protein KGI71_06125 [Patescibacteria group bacterium]|nr:hypothetical protein [Patescibacteria group bacterium]